MDLEDRRKALFSVLTTVLVVSQEKFKMERGKSDRSRIKCGGLIVGAVQAYAKLLETAQSDQLAKDVELIKKKVGII